MQKIQILGDTEAMAAIQAILSELQKRQKTAVIAVADAYGELVGLLRTTGAPLSSIVVATNKAFTSARQKERTGAIGESMRQGGSDFSFFGDPRYMGWQGGVPVWHREQVVGAVAVSGLTGEEDEALAEIGLAAIAALWTKEGL